MIKKELVQYFSYFVKQGKSIGELQDEALEKGYSVEDINDSFSVIDEQGNVTIKFRKKLSRKMKVLILSLLILIILLSITVGVILMFLR